MNWLLIRTRDVLRMCKVTQTPAFLTGFLLESRLTHCVSENVHSHAFSCDLVSLLSLPSLHVCHRMCYALPQIICWSLHPQGLWMWLHSKISLFKAVIQVRSLRCALIQYGWCPSKKRRLGNRHVQKGDNEKTQVEDSQPSVSHTERPGADSPSQSQKEALQTSWSQTAGLQTMRQYMAV